MVSWMGVCRECMYSITVAVYLHTYHHPSPPHRRPQKTKIPLFPPH